jgi:hypothetical protein
MVGCGRKGKHFSVGRHIVEELRLIMSPGNDLILADHYCSHRDFTGFVRHLSLLHGFFHEVFVTEYA